LTTVTELGCFPVKSIYQTKEFGSVITNYFNNVIGITNPNLLEPPEFCADAVMDAEADPRDYLSVYVKEN
uniref:Ependymin n=1 Tax=Oryzias latipes TaxID=8090 RepID=A0A3P9HZR9_ORYLA